VITPEVDRDAIPGLAAIGGRSFGTGYSSLLSAAGATPKAGVA